MDFLRITALIVFLGACTKAPVVNQRDAACALDSSSLACQPVLDHAGLNSPASSNIKEPFQVSWDAIGGASSYDLIISKDEACNNHYIAMLGQNQTSINLSIAEAGTYYICVFAKDESGGTIHSITGKKIEIKTSTTSQASAALANVGNPSFSLTSKALTQGTTGSVSINCDKAQQYQITTGNSVPDSSSAEWTDCNPGDFAKAITYPSGSTNFHIWFKDSSDLVDTTERKVFAHSGLFYSLVDPNPHAGDMFGSTVIKFSNGNLLVGEALDDTKATDAGAAHLYSGSNGQLIKSYYGNTAADKTGNTSTFNPGLFELPNGNFLICNTDYTHNGMAKAGRIILANATTGAIVTTIYGDDADDQLCYGAGSSSSDYGTYNGGITILSNGNFAVASTYEYNGGGQVGSFKLFNGATGEQIGSTIYGEQIGDGFPSMVVELSNGNIGVACNYCHRDGNLNSGLVMVVSGTTGAQLGSSIKGASDNDNFGKRIFALSNGNLVVTSPYVDFGGNAEAGSLVLIDGTTGAQIGSTVYGDGGWDKIGDFLITLPNGNYVAASKCDDNGGASCAGSVDLYNGLTGAKIGAGFKGDNSNDELGKAESKYGVRALSNSNFVIASWRDDVGVTDGGSIIVVNGSTGAQVGSTITGDQTQDRIGNDIHVNGTTIVATSYHDDNGGTADVGSIMIIDGTTGAQVGSTIYGDEAGDWIGTGSANFLPDGNVAICSSWDHNGGTADVGSVRLINTSTGALIGSPIYGEDATDRLCGSIKILTNGNFVVGSSSDNNGGTSDVGSSFLVNGTTGAMIGSKVYEDSASDKYGSSIYQTQNGSFVIISQYDDQSGLTDVGSIRVFNSTTGAQIGSTLYGETAGDKLGRYGAVENGNFVVVPNKDDDVNSLVDAGSVIVVINE